MKKNRLIFYSVFGVLHLFIFFFSFYMDSNSENFDLLLSLQSKIWVLKYCSTLLLAMFITNVVLHVRDNKRNQKLQDEQAKEMTELKAKLYDKGISKATPVPAAPKAT
jgi:hypothetical protein